jgi:hypothetical protein
MPFELMVVCDRNGVEISCIFVVWALIFISD